MKKNMQLDFCVKRKRKQPPYLVDKYGIESPYFMIFKMVQSTVFYRRKFKHVDITANQDGFEYCLCKNCKNYLTLNSKYDKELFS